MGTFLLKRLLEVVLLLAVIGTVQGDHAADQEVPVRPVLDDEVKIENLLEVMLDALRSFIGSIFDDCFPQFFVGSTVDRLSTMIVSSIGPKTDTISSRVIGMAAHLHANV